MDAHHITAAAYVVIAVVLLLLWIWMVLRGEELVNSKHLTKSGRQAAAHWLPILRYVALLFVLFIGACAFDHLAHGRLLFVAELEAVVSIITALVTIMLLFYWRKTKI